MSQSRRDAVRRLGQRSSLQIFDSPAIEVSEPSDPESTLKRSFERLASTCDRLMRDYTTLLENARSLGEKWGRQGLTAKQAGDFGVLEKDESVLHQGMRRAFLEGLGAVTEGRRKRSVK